MATLETYAMPVMGNMPVQSVDVGMVHRVPEPIWSAAPYGTKAGQTCPEQSQCCGFRDDGGEVADANKPRSTDRGLFFLRAAIQPWKVARDGSISDAMFT